MTVNRTTLLDLPLPVTGTESGTWGDTTNNGLTQYVDIAIAGMSNLTSANFTAGALTIETTEGDSSATNISATSAQYAGFRVTSLAANSTITVGNTGTSPARSYRLINADATYNLTFKATGQTGVTLLPGQSALVAFNGTDYVIVGTVGAGSTTDNTVPRFDGTTGKILQSSGITIDDSNNVSGVAQLNITTLDATNIEVTNIKAKDGTAAASIADSTGVISITSNPVLSGGTANGVLYLNGSKVATSGSALTFDGTTLKVQNNNAATPVFQIQSYSSVNNGIANITYDQGTDIYKLSNPSTYGGSGIDFGTGTSSTTRYHIDTSGVHVWTVASEAMRLTSTGLGIGTSSPAAKLHVNGDIRIADTSSLLMGVGAEQKIFVAGGANNTYLTFNQWTGSAYTERMRLDSSGNLGLGVTPSAWNTGRAIELGNVGNALWSANQVDVFATMNAYQVSGGSWIYASTNPASLFEQYNGNFYWKIAPSGTAGNAITFSQVMTLDASGNLGIGTSSPGTKLHVVTDGSVDPLRLQSTQTGYERSWTIGPNVGNNGYFAVRDSTAGANRLEISTSGNLGLGVTPSAWNSSLKGLQVQTTTVGANNGSWSLFGYNTYYGASGYNYVLSDYAVMYQQGSGQHRWYTAPSGTAGNAITFSQAMTLDASGNLIVGGTTPLVTAANRGNITINGSSSSLVALGVSNTATASFYADATVVNLSARTNIPLLLSTNDTERARITSGGVSTSKFWWQCTNWRHCGSRYNGGNKQTGHL